MIADEIFAIVPAGIRSFFVKPPLLATESLQSYGTLFHALVNLYRPGNTADWLRVKDVADFTCETLRLRLLKVRMLDLEGCRSLSVLLHRIKGLAPAADILETERMAEQYFISPEIKQHVDNLLRAHRMDDDSVHAQALYACVATMESLAKMELAAWSQRERVMEVLDRRRENILPQIGHSIAEVTAEAIISDSSQDWALNPGASRPDTTQLVLATTAQDATTPNTSAGETKCMAVDGAAAEENNRKAKSGGNRNRRRAPESGPTSQLPKANAPAQIPVNVRVPVQAQVPVKAQVKSDPELDRFVTRLVEKLSHVGELDLTNPTVRRLAGIRP